MRDLLNKSESRFSALLVLTFLVLSVLPLFFNLLGFDFGYPMPSYDKIKMASLADQEFKEQAYRLFTREMLHATMEWIIISTDAAIILFALFYYYISRNAYMLFIGLFLLLASTMDTLQLLYIYRFLEVYVDNDKLIPYAWAISRIFRLMVFSLGLAFLLFRKKEDIRINWISIGFIVLCIGVVAAGFTYCVTNINEVPQVLFPQNIIKRPYDLFTLLFLLVVTFPLAVNLYEKFPSFFTSSLVIVIFPLAVAELHLSFASGEVYDNDFYIAYYLRILANLILLTGIALDYIDNYRQKILAIQKANDALDDLRNAQLAKTHFIAHISNQIRTPMSGVMGTCNLLLKTDLDQGQRKLARIISQSSGTLLGIVGEIVDLTKIEENALDIKFLLFDIKELIMNTVSSLEPIAREKKLFFHVNILNEIPSLVYGEQGKMRQILLSILTEAVRNSISDSVGIEVEAVTLDDGKWDFSIGITYAGPRFDIGFPSGLAKEINGAVIVESRQLDEHGVRIDIPLKARKKILIPKKLSEFLLGYKILVVETGPLASERYAEIIKTFGTRCVTAASEEEAIELMRNREGFDAIIFGDLEGEVDVMSLAKALREIPDYASSIIIAATEDTNIDIPTELNINYLLKKPVRPSDLFYVLYDIIYKENPVYAADKEGMRIYPEPGFLKLRLLVAEEDYISQYVIREYLERYGCRVSVVPDGKTALEKFSNEEFDCLFVDTRMGEMDALSIAKEVRSREKESLKKPIFMVALLTEAILEDTESYLDAGIDMLLSKPVEEEELLSVLITLKERD